MKIHHFSRSILIAAASALALSACAIDSVGDAVLDTRSALGDDEPVMPQEEFLEIRDNCRVPGAVLSRQGAGWRLGLPADVYAARETQPTAGRIACLTHWARERGLDLVVGQVRN